MIKPWHGYITVIDVEHEDKLQIVKTEFGDSPIAKYLGIPTEVQCKQGVAAGRVVEVGEGVTPLTPGTKIYYGGCLSIEINDVKVVPVQAVIAWEEDE